MTVAALNTAILDGLVRLAACECTAVVIEARLDGEPVVLHPTCEAIADVGLVAVNAQSGGAVRVTAENALTVGRWLAAGRVTVHHTHDCDRTVRTARRPT